MNLKSKAISEIRATIKTLIIYPEFADRIEGLQVLLGELEAEQGGKGVPTWDEISKRADDHITAHHPDCIGTRPLQILMYEKLHMAYIKSAQWAISQMQPEWVSVTNGYPETGTQCYFYRNGISDFVYTGNYKGIDQWNEPYFKDDIHAAYYRDVTDYMVFETPQPPTK